MSTGARVRAIAQSAGIPAHTLRQILITLETLNWMQCEWQEKSLLRVSEKIPPMEELVTSADALLQMASPEAVEIAILRLLDATTVVPITVRRALDIGSSVASEGEAQRALDLLGSLNLVHIAQSADGHRVVFNPNVWASDADHSAAALKCEDGAVHAAVSGLIEEITATPGLPEQAVTSTEPKWVHFAVAHNLVQRSLVRTSDGDEKSFLFTPHMSRNAFEAPSGADPSGHVRQLIGSMVYAQRFAHFRLWGPKTFLRALIRDGEAGDVPNIRTDYPMLETAGIVRVEPARRAYKLVLLQADVAERALEFWRQADRSEEIGSASALGQQRDYVHPEQERARLGKLPEASSETERLLAALRETAGRREYGS
ncbi:MAG TPA: hypothetical protein VHJ34_09755 [Actinomycetota bacterium]|nr:hypothetical protein [Actinomycetota bacterium]